jgi:Flp pilus assembly protein TadD
LAGQGDLKAAIAAYSKSLELDPNGPERWLALAAVYDRDNQPEQARFAREKAGNLAATPTPTPTPSPTPAPTPTPKPPAPTPTPKK